MLSSEQFLVIPGLNFTCNGAIASFLLGGDVRSGRNDYLKIDLWRPENNIFRYVKFSHREISLSAGDFSPDEVLWYNLTTPINFQSGDVLGVYQLPHSKSVVRLFYTTQPTPPVGYKISGENYWNTYSVSTSGHQLFDGSLLLHPVIGENVINNYYNTKYLYHWLFLSLRQ